MMNLKSFLRKLNEEWITTDIEKEAPKEFGVIRYGDDDAGGKGPQMGVGDPWEDFQESVKKNFVGYAIDEGNQQYGF